MEYLLVNKEEKEKYLKKGYREASKKELKHFSPKNTIEGKFVNLPTTIVVGEIYEDNNCIYKDINTIFFNVRMGELKKVMEKYKKVLFLLVKEE